MCPCATVTWSMIPHGAPTTWFSASWQSAASRSGSTAVGAERTRAVATSSAALDDTPTDCGTSDDTESCTRGGSITPWRTSTSATPIT